MNAALELGACSARQDGTPGRWTDFGRTCPYEYVGRAGGLGNEPTEGSRGAFWRRDGIAGQCVERCNEAAAKILDLGERVRLPASVLQSQNRSFIKGSGGWIEMPRAGFLSRRDFSDKVRKRDGPISDASSRA